MGIQLKIAAREAHDAFAAYAETASELQLAVSRLGESNQPMSHRDMGAALAKLHEQGVELLDRALARGKDALAFRQALHAPGVADVLCRFDAQIAQLMSEEASGRLDRRQLRDAIETLGRAAQDRLATIIAVVQQVVAAVEDHPDFGAPNNASSTSASTPIDGDARTVLLAVANYEKVPNDPERGHHQLGGARLEQAAGMKGGKLEDAVDMIEGRGLLQYRKRTTADSIGTIKLNAQGRLEAQRLSQSSGAEAAAMNDQPGVDPLVLRRELLEELYKLNATSPQATGLWNADRNDPQSAARAREAEYLKEKGLVSGTIGGHGDLALRLTAGGRDYVEAGGFWSRRSRPEDAAASSSTPGSAPESEFKLPRMDVRYGEKLGSGAFGTVWQATDQLLDREIAVKFLTSTNEYMDEAALLREARSLAKVSHPNLVVVHGAAWLRHPQTGLVQPAIVMELLVGEVLLKWRERQHTRDDVLRVAIGILRGVQAMHDAGLHHSDLHPKNVIVLTSGEPKLIDWRYQDTFLEHPTEHRLDLIEAEQRRTIDLVVTLLEKQGLFDESLKIRGQSSITTVLALLQELQVADADFRKSAQHPRPSTGALLEVLTEKGGGGYNLVKLALELGVKPSEVRPLIEELFKAGEIELLTLNDDDVVYRLTTRGQRS